MGFNSGLKGLTQVNTVPIVDCVWNVMVHAQKRYFVFRRNGPVHLNRRGRQFSRLLAAEVCASAVVMLDTPCSEEVWRVLATHAIRQFPPSLPLPCVTVCHHVSTGLYKRLGATQGRSGRMWLREISFPPPEFEPRTVRSIVSRYKCIGYRHHTQRHTYIFRGFPQSLQAIFLVVSVISGPLRDANEIWVLLGCYAA
jgi:hypothetical protein